MTGSLGHVSAEEIAETLDGILDKYQMPKVNPLGWSDSDYERVADYVEPMRREIEILREKVLMGVT